MSKCRVVRRRDREADFPTTVGDRFSANKEVRNELRLLDPELQLALLFSCLPPLSLRLYSFIHLCPVLLLPSTSSSMAGKSKAKAKPAPKEPASSQVSSIFPLALPSFLTSSSPPSLPLQQGSSGSEDA